MSDTARTFDPSELDAVLFDLDGVLTRTAAVHYAAWKRVFEEYLSERGTSPETFSEADYREHVDGKPRYDGVEDFLRSRGIELERGTPDDPPDRETVCGVGNRKNEHFRRQLEERGVEVFDDAVALIRRLRGRSVAIGVFSASRNCRAVLQQAGLTELFDARVDGLEADRLGLEGKPAPDMLLETARRLAVEPTRCAIIEDANAGVEAGRRGEFAVVVGVDRGGAADDLRAAGADLVTGDLASLLAQAGEISSPEDAAGRVLSRSEGRVPAVFLDYDGTLTPIVEDPENAVLGGGMRDAIRRLARRCTVAVVSGRDLRDVRAMVGLDELVFAGSHGFEIAGPDDLHLEQPEGVDALPDLLAAAQTLRSRMENIPGVWVERKRFAVAVHTRRADRERVPDVKDEVERVVGEHRSLRLTGGKEIFELRPDVDWDKGRAVLWLLDALGVESSLPVYVGDDDTDEDAFRALAGRGIGIRVGEGDTDADLTLADPDAVERFLDMLASRLEGEQA